MTDFYLIVAVLNLALAITGAGLMLQRYWYLRHRFHPQEKVFWTGVSALLAVTGYGFVETIYQDEAGALWELLVTGALIWVDVALLKPFVPDRAR